ncbi:TRAP transporter small permease [Pokkaliibacter sp. MBI-7]|uniref:TRAP transporter small permease n=1 Tax=Pokkaliibacter sp. MBI-7 TaxID=3040600 RepID=UPI002449222A|nr:TRAP transporter small permease [Pokkaliibacter sp. MBI-7]MDH2435349.1 TRAP transporter small permease [Pokkaliibacter sp. MBI-7]
MASLITSPSSCRHGVAMSPLKILRKGFEYLLEGFTVALLLGLTVIVLSAVLLRMLGSSFTWYDEVASIGLAWLSFYGASLAALKRAHMGFPGIVSKAPGPLRSVLFILSELIVIGFFAVIAKFGYDVLDVLAWDNLVSLPWISLSFTQSVIPVSAGLFILCELLSMPDAWRKMRQGVDSEHEAIEEAIRLAEEGLAQHQAREVRP